MASSSTGLECPHRERRELGVHHVPMFNCRLCSYQACRPCSVGLLAKLIELPRGTDAIDVDGEDERCRAQARMAARDGARCPLCKEGSWELIPVPYFRWKCEGPQPRSRFKDGVISAKTARNCAFEIQPLQQHHEKKQADSIRNRHVAVHRAWFVAMVPQDPEAARQITAASMSILSPSRPAKTPIEGHVAKIRVLVHEGQLRHGTRRRTAAARQGLLLHQQSSSSSSSDDDSSDGDDDDASTSSAADSVRELVAVDASNFSGALVSKTPAGKGNSPVDDNAASPTVTAPQQTFTPPLALPPPEYHQPSRGACCVEGRKFIFRVANTGPPVNMFWFAVADIATSERETFGLAKHPETCVPISGFVCPTTDSTTLLAQDPVSVPMVCDLALLGILGRYHVRRLALYEGPPVAESNALEGYEGCGICKPLLVVNVLSNVSMLRHVSMLAPLDSVLARQLQRPASHSPPSFDWAIGLEKAVEGLLTGRCVAFYGIGCKRHLLDYISDAAELCHFALHVFDPWALGASPAALGSGSQQPVIAVKAYAAAFERLVGNIVKFDAAHAEECAKRRQLRESQLADASQQAGELSRSPTMPAFKPPPVEALPTQQLGAAMSLNVGPTQAPAVDPSQSGAGDLFDLGPTAAMQGFFDVTCGDHAFARAIVSRAVDNSSVRRRVTSLLDAPPLDEALRHLIVIPNIDALDDGTIARFATLHEQRRDTVGLVASFDTPTFPVTCVAGEALGFQLVHIQTLLPYTRDGLGRVASTQLEAFVADASRSSRSAVDGANGPVKSAARRGRTTELDPGAVSRSLLSVPQAFRTVLKHILRRQREVGDDVLMGVNALIDHLANRCQVYLSTSRMAGIIRELKSNRIVHYDDTVHAFKIQQLGMVEELLDAVNEAAANTSGTATVHAS